MKAPIAVRKPIVLPWPLQSSLEAAARALLESSDGSYIDFSQPIGEAALISPDSVSWRVFKNPISLFIGGVTAVIMELAEPGAHWRVGAHDIPCESDVTAAPDRARRHGDNLRCPQHRRGYDSARSANARERRRHHTIR